MFCTCYFEAGDSDQRKKTACFVTKIEPMLAYSTASTHATPAQHAGQVSLQKDRMDGGPSFRHSRVTLMIACALAIYYDLIAPTWRHT